MLIGIFPFPIPLRHSCIFLLIIKIRAIGGEGMLNSDMNNNIKAMNMKLARGKTFEGT